MRNPFHAGPSSSLTIVIKLGTSSIIHPDTHQPLLSLLSSIVETICALRAQGHRVVLVSSGAIGVGMKRMGVRERGKGLAGKQVRCSVCSSALPPRDVVRRLASLSEADSVHCPVRPWQALAAIGQGRLIALWDNLFSQLSQPIAQILLTRGDISDRTRYLNAVNTLTELLNMGVVPIVNENDTISVSVRLAFRSRTAAPKHRLT
jgi:glutamate 5-kinase